MTKFEDALKEVEKWYWKASDVVEENTLKVDEHRKTLLQESEALDDTLATLQDEVANLRLALCDSLQRNMQIMLGVHDRVVEHASKLFPDTIISAEELDMFHSTLGMTHESDPGTSAPDATI